MNSTKYVVFEKTCEKDIRKASFNTFRDALDFCDYWSLYKRDIKLFIKTITNGKCVGFYE